MNHYFSRLAQRSSIVAPGSSRQSQAVHAHASNVGSASVDVTTTNYTSAREHSSDAWDEQNIEMVSPVGYADVKLENVDHATSAAINHNSINQSSIAPRVNAQAASTTLDNIGINSMQVTASRLQSGLIQPQSISTDVHSDTVDTLTNISTNSLSTISYPEHKNVPSLPGSSFASGAAGMQRGESDNFPEKNIVTEQRQNIPASTEPYRKTIVVESVQRTGNTIALDNSNNQGFYGHSVIEENQTKKTSARPESEVQSTSAIAATNRAGRAVSNAVAATPTEIPTALINRPDAAPRSGVQVNIGKIELEIFAPQKKVVQAPPPAAPVVKPALREPVFNPHRHYLRSR